MTEIETATSKHENHIQCTVLIWAVLPVNRTASVAWHILRIVAFQTCTLVLYNALWCDKQRHFCVTVIFVHVCEPRVLGGCFACRGAR